MKGPNRPHGCLRSEGGKGTQDGTVTTTAIPCPAPREDLPVPPPGSELSGHTDAAASSWQPRWTKAASVLPGLLKSLLCQSDLLVTP